MGRILVCASLFGVLPGMLACQATGSSDVSILPGAQVAAVNTLNMNVRVGFTQPKAYRLQQSGFIETDVASLRAELREGSGSPITYPAATVAVLEPITRVGLNPFNFTLNNLKFGTSYQVTIVARRSDPNNANALEDIGQGVQTFVTSNNKLSETISITVPVTLNDRVYQGSGAVGVSFNSGALVNPSGGPTITVP